MRPMRKGATRRALTSNLIQLTSGDINIDQASAILAGGIDDALNAIGVSKGMREKFWITANVSTWRLFEAHRASGTLDKIK